MNLLCFKLFSYFKVSCLPTNFSNLWQNQLTFSFVTSAFALSVRCFFPRLKASIKFHSIFYSVVHDCGKNCKRKLTFCWKRANWIELVQVNKKKAVRWIELKREQLSIQKLSTFNYRTAETQKQPIKKIQAGLMNETKIIPFTLFITVYRFGYQSIANEFVLKTIPERVALVWIINRSLQICLQTLPIAFKISFMNKIRLKINQNSIELQPGQPDV